MHEAIQGISVGRRVIVGGDFHTQLHSGWRSDMLMTFAAEHGLDIPLDNPDLPWSKRWTFESSMGIMQQFDFVVGFMIGRKTAGNQTLGFFFIQPT